MCSLWLQDNRVHIGPKMEIRVVTLGLDGAGKTTILFKLKQDEFMQPIPTIGTVESVHIQQHTAPQSSLNKDGSLSLKGLMWKLSNIRT